MSFYDDASLVLIPSGYKAGKVYSQKPLSTDGELTFTRASEATRVNSAGNIEKARTNSLLQSNTFSTTWTTSNASVTGGQSDKDGGTDAWELKNNSGATNTARVQQLLTKSSGVYSFSVYAKAGNVNYLRILSNASSNVSVAWFNLTDGTAYNASNTIDTDSENVGGGWYRCTITFNNSSTGCYLYPTGVAGSTLSDNGEYIYIQDAQLEQGLVATDYIETTTAAVTVGIYNDVPRLDYSGGATCPSLLLEPQRTNLVIHSEYTDGANWSNEGSIGDEENTSETTSPEGYYNAVKLVSNNATSEQWLQASVNVTSTGYYTASCFVKKSDYDFFYIRFTGANSVWGAGGAWFNINTGSVATIQSGVTADIVDYGNGWYRVSATKEAVNTGVGAIRFQLVSSDNDPIVAGDGSKGTYTYGFQVEAGSYATSYIPTYGSTVTRSIDECYKSGLSLLQQTEGTLFVEFERIGASGASFENLVFISDASLSNFANIVYDPSLSRYKAQVRSGGVTDGLVTASSEYSGKIKIALSFDASGLTLHINGVLQGTDASPTTPAAALTAMGIGGYYTTSYGDPLRGDIYKALYIPSRLSNADLVTLTT